MIAKDGKHIPTVAINAPINPKRLYPIYVAAFIAIGMFVSSLTENQLAAAVGTIAIIMAFLLIGLINTFLPASYWLRYVFDSVSIFTRFQSFVNGYFEFASVIYYLSMLVIFVYFTIRVYDRRRYN